MSILTRVRAVHRVLHPQVFTHARKGLFSPSFSPKEAIFHWSDPSAISYEAPSKPSLIQSERTDLVGSTFLEELNEDYGVFEKGLHPAVSDRATSLPYNNATQIILRLIAKGNLNAALAAKNEFDTLGIKITKHTTFADTAIKTLSLIDPLTRARSFITWWALAALGSCPEKVTKAYEKLMATPYDIPLLMDFTVISVKSGCAEEILRTPVFSHIVRFGEPNATTAFLLKLEDEIKRRPKRDGDKTWVVLRNKAIKMHLLAGRIQVAANMYESANGKMDIKPEITKLMEASRSCITTAPPMDIPPSSMRRYVVRERNPPPEVLASELRMLRRAIRAGIRPPHFESYLADFIFAYEILGRKERAIRMLRKKVFQSCSLAARARWISGEQLFYSARKRPLANIRTFMHYCLADHVLAVEGKRVLDDWISRKTYRRRSIDWHFAPMGREAHFKIWPSRLSVNLAWKAILQLSDVNEIERLYALLVAQTEAARREPKELALCLRTATHSAADMQAADVYYYDKASEIISFPPAVFPDAGFFHHFVVAFATRVSVRRAGEVLVDMQRLHLRPFKDSWGAMAGAYARSGDSNRVQRILDHIDAIDADLAQKASTENNEADWELQKNISRAERTTLMTYNSVIRGFTGCRKFAEARAVCERMKKHKLEDGRTRSLISRLVKAEKGVIWRTNYEHMRPRGNVLVGGRPIYVDTQRAEWLYEEFTAHG